jgi:gluconate 2-dehydrogenase gamma chain
VAQTGAVAALAREDDMADDTLPRRSFLKGAGAAGAAVATALTAPTDQAQAQGQAQPAPVSAVQAPASDAYLTLTATEAAFLSAAYDTFIPADRLSPSGTECGLVTYMDRQLAGAWGNGARFYRGGPFLKGKPEHGHQLPLTPREFFADGIKAANAWSRKTYGKDFDRLSPADRDAALKAMDQGKAEFPDFNAKPFFEALYQSAMEGFFADPIYGGNRNKASWRMVGYPGLPASYGAKAEAYRGKKIHIEPQSIADFS